MSRQLTSWIFFALYRYFLIPMTVFFLKISRPLLPNKLKVMIEERLNFHWPELPSRPIWIHAASGEIEYAKPVIRALKERWPQRMILITYYSPSAKKLIKSMPGIDAVVPLPWDERHLVKKFLDHFRPEILLIARTDVWPEFAYECRRRGISSLLFSATLATQSSRNGLLSSPLTRFAFNQLSAVNCVSEEDIEEIAKIGSIVPCHNSGDTRYDQVRWRIQNPAPIKPLNLASSEVPAPPTLVIGSSWPQDEEVLLPVLPEFIKNGGRVVIAPHEVDSAHLNVIQKKLQSLGVKSILYSSSETWNSNEVLLIDQIGHLQEVYTWGDLAFVGGSFKSKVHSVMEPLAAGLPTLVGPFHLNNREALHFQNSFIKTNESVNKYSFSLVSIIRDQQELSWHLERLLKNQLIWPKLKLRIGQKISEKSGATELLLGQIGALSQ